MKNFALQQPSEDWMILEFSQLGFIGESQRSAPSRVETPPSPDGRGAERRVCCSFNGHLWELPGVVSFSFWRDSKQVNKHLKHSVQLQTHGQHSAQSVSLPNAFDSQAFCELAGLIKRTTSVRADGWWSSRSARLQSHRLSDWLADTGEPLERCTLAVIWIRLSLRYFM